MATCPSCGTRLAYCPYCGAGLVLRARPSVEKPPTEVVPTPPLPPLREAEMCFFHPSVRAVKVCDMCGKLLCGACSRSYRELDLCQADYDTLTRPEPAKAPAVLPVRAPRRKLTVGLLTSLVSGALVLASVLLMGPFQWGTQLMLLPLGPGTEAIVMGLACGLGILGSVFLGYWLGRETEGGIIVLILSVISMAIGGGFFIGSIIGVLGGMLTLLGE